MVEINGWLNFSNVFTNVLYQCWKRYVFKSTFNSGTNIWGHIVEYFKWVYQSLGERFELKALLQNERLLWFKLTKLQFKITKSSFMASFNFKWVYQGLVKKFEIKTLLQNKGLFWFDLTKSPFKITKTSFSASFYFKSVYQGLV